MREHSEKIAPPRTLWVSFPLGRPFGPPASADFQRRVVVAALQLLERSDGPSILADFPEDSPQTETNDGEGFVCPVSFPPPPVDGDKLEQAVAAEIMQLSPWYQLSVERRGRTTVGLSGMEIDAVARFVAGFRAPEPPARNGDDRPIGWVLKAACDDLKAFYYEAGTAQPGQQDGEAIEAWFWDGTAAGSLLREVRTRCMESADDGIRQVASRVLLPKSRGG